MFQSLRQNSQLYVFYKGDNPRLARAMIVSPPVSRPKYQVPANFGQSEMVVDIIAKVNGQTVNYNGLPAHLDIADSVLSGENIVVSDNKEAMNAEILSLKQKSIDIINSVDFHKNLIKNCDLILSELNPEFAEKKAQKEEIDTLKIQVNDLSSSIKELMETNKILINKLSIKNE